MVIRAKACAYVDVDRGRNGCYLPHWMNFGHRIRLAHNFLSLQAVQSLLLNRLKNDVFYIHRFQTYCIRHWRNEAIGHAGLLLDGCQLRRTLWKQVGGVLIGAEKVSPPGMYGMYGDTKRR